MSSLVFPFHPTESEASVRGPRLVEASILLHPRPPLRLQLLGITQDGTGRAATYRATLYDPDADQIVIVASGDKVGPRTVASISADRIAFTLGTATQIST